MKKNIDQIASDYLNGIQPIDRQNAPDDFVTRVMNEIELYDNDKVISIKGKIFWKSIAAGVTLLAGVNIYTLISNIKYNSSDLLFTQEIVNEYQTIQANSYAALFEE